MKILIPKDWRKIMRKFFILFLLFVLCPRGFARDYEFTIGSHNMDTDLLSVYEFKYSGNELTLTNTWGWLGSMATDELLKEKIKSVEIGESGIVYFINAADKIVAGVFSTADGSEGFILYVNEEGNLIKTKPKNVGDDFAKDFQELKKSIPKHGSKPQANSTKVDTGLMKLLEGPYGLSPSNPSQAGIQDWRNIMKKFNPDMTEQTSLGWNILEGKNKPVKILDHDANCKLMINLHNFKSRYFIGVDGKAEALKLFDEIVQTLKASGVTWKGDETDLYPLRTVTGNWKDRYIKLSFSHNVKNLYSIFLESIGRRNFSKEDYEIVLSPSTSLGTSLFGIPGISIVQPIEEIVEGFKLSLIPGSISLKNESIKTVKDEIEQTLFIPLKGGGNQWFGLKTESESMKLENNEGKPIFIASFKLWPSETSKLLDLSYKEEEQIVAKLYSELIGELKAANKPLRKASMKELNLKKSDIDAKEVWAVDYADYTDYYIFRKHKYLKNICIISVKK